MKTYLLHPVHTGPNKIYLEDAKNQRSTASQDLSPLLFHPPSIHVSKTCRQSPLQLLKADGPILTLCGVRKSGGTAREIFMLISWGS